MNPHEAALAAPLPVNLEADDPSGDARWVALAREGDRDAFGVLVRRHEQAVLAFLIRYVGDRDTARELAQASFLTAWERLGGFRGEAQFKTWLFALAANRARNHLTRYRNRHRPLDGQPEPSVPGGMLEGLLHAEAQQAARAAMEALPEGQRALAALRLQEGMDYDRIGAILNCSPDSARVRFHKIIVQLRIRLAPYLKGEP